MTIASKANLLRIGFIGLGVGNGLTTDYTNNADGERIEKDDQSRITKLSVVLRHCVSSKTVFTKPCYPQCYSQIDRLLRRYFSGAAISCDRRMYKRLPTKHTKRHESFTTQILLPWCASRVSWAPFLREPSVLSASRAVGKARQKEKPRG